MNEEKRKIKSNNWGGRRPNSGRPATGILKKKVSVSISQKVWEQAMDIWDGKASHLVDKLLKDYVGETPKS